jgi:putative FmdB family regulatory protein
MPTYDYECEKCGHEFEAFHSMKEPSIEDCPECKAKKSVRRLIGSGAGIIFKGTGFYETDYKRKSSPGSISESNSSSESKSSGSSKTNGSSKKNGKATTS